MATCFFVLSKYDLTNYSELIKESDILLSVSFIPELNDSGISYVCLDNYNEDLYDKDKFELFFKSYFDFDEDAWAFSNNFYETCYEYPLKINNLILKYNIDNFYFPREIKIFSAFGLQKLVAAEYETQNIFLYNREATFLYLIKKISSNKNIKLNFLKEKPKKVYISLNLLRLLMLFSFELYRVLKSINKISSINTNKSKFLYLFRTSIASNFSSFRFKKEANEINYFNSISHQNSSRKEVVHKNKLVPFIFDLLCVIFKVINNICIILFKKIPGEINFKQAFFEIQIMSIQPRLYFLTLNRAMKKLKDVETIFNFEVKSPYAFFDEKNANKLGKKLITILSFDLLKKKMPEIFFSKNLHVSSLSLRKQLNEVVVGNKNVFSIYNLHSTRVNNVVDEIRFSYCVFLDAVNLKSNIKILDFLLLGQYNFCVRKHPRDDYKYNKNYSKLFIDRDVSDFDLFRSFKFGITGASGIVEVLIANEKPFYLIEEYGFGFTTSMHYYYEEYYGNIKNIETLKTHRNDSLLIQSFNNFYIEDKPNFNLADFYAKIDKI